MTMPAQRRRKVTPAVESPSALSPGENAILTLLGSLTAELPAPPEFVVKQIPLHRIVPSPFQARQHGFDPDDPDLRSLAKSIRAGGVIEPLVVRPQADDAYEIVAGQRRWVASCLQGEDLDAFGPPPFYVPATVRALSDQTAAVLAAAENLYRKDLDILEAATSVGVLLEAFHGDSEAVASHLGQPARWVACRARIHSNLSPAWRDTFAQPGSVFSKWTAGHLEEVAKLPRDVQDELLRGRLSYGSAMTVDALKRIIADFTRELGKAPFATDDETLVPEVGPCTTCPDTSLAVPLLFDDVEPCPTSICGARCLRATCWTRKAQAHLERLAAELALKHEDLVYVYDPNNEEDEYEDETPPSLADMALPFWAWRLSKKKSRGSVPAMVISGPDRGKLLYVTVSQTPPRDEPEPAQAPSETPSEPLSKDAADAATLAQRRKLHFNRRLARMVGLVRGRVESFSPAALTPAAAIALSTVFGSRQWFRHGEDPWTRFAELRDAGDATCIATLWAEHLAPVLLGRLVYGGPQSVRTLEQDLRGTLLLLSGGDPNAFDELFRTIAHELPEPKSWRTLRGYVPEDLGGGASAEAATDPQELLLADEGPAADAA